MELLDKISSKYIINKIFDYINDNNFFKYKLVVHSKKFQQILNIRLFDYQNIYLGKTGLRSDIYIYNENNEYEETFDKFIYNKLLERDLVKMKLNQKEFEAIVYNAFNNNDNDNDNANKYRYYNQEDKIDIYSPFFNIISKTKLIEVYSIPITINVIKKYKLKNDYILAFENMNKSKFKYTSLIINYKLNKDIDFLKELNIDFKNIKKISFNIKEDEGETGDKEENIENIENCNYFLKNLFSFDNFGSNLLFLNIQFPIKEDEALDINLIKNINNLKLLKFLILSEFILNETFEINLQNLEVLKLENCENIFLAGGIYNNLNYLFLIDSIVFMVQPLLKFPNLTNSKLVDDEQQKYSSIIDFSSLKNLEKITCDIFDFVYLEDTLLENVEIHSKIKHSRNLEIKAIEKLISIKTLKTISIELHKIDTLSMPPIPGENLSPTNMTINWGPSKVNCAVGNLEFKFPNLIDFTINLPYCQDIYDDFIDDDDPPIIDIYENQNCKVSNLTLNIASNNYIDLICAPFTKLKKLEFNLIRNIKLFSVLPVFEDNCKGIFTSLTSFHFRTGNNKEEIDFNYIKNLYNNIDCMPNLIEFYLDCIKSVVDKEFYDKFILKLLSLKLNSIHFSIKNGDDEKDETYSKDELIKIYPSINYDKYDKIFIKKYNF